MASGDTLLVFTPLGNEPPSASSAVITLVNNTPVLSFLPTGANEAALFSAIVPSFYSGGGITVKIHYAMATATAGDIIWEVSFDRKETTSSINVDGFGGVKTVTQTVPGTNLLISKATIAFSDGAEINSAAIGDFVRVKIRRIDTTPNGPSGNALLIAMELVET